MLELTCHGGAVTVALAVEALLAAGARGAEPGEFTMRAFLAGKLDLSSAEGIVDQIDARTPVSQRLAARQREGSVRRAVEAIRDGIIALLAAYEASIDFPDEVDEPDRAGVLVAVEDLAGQVGALRATHSASRQYREGVRAALVGPPNAGKSSLLNALVGRERAIVSPSPGTTRDTVEAVLQVNGVEVTLIDTAGIRDGVDEIETAGVERALAEASHADALIVVLDATDLPAAGWWARHDPGLASVAVCAINKTDLIGSGGHKELCETVRKIVGDIPVVPISARTCVGAQGLLERLVARPALDLIDPIAAVVMSSRHADALSKAGSALAEVDHSLRAELPPDVVCVDLLNAATLLGEITGETADDEVIKRVFASFCVGK